MDKKHLNIIGIILMSMFILYMVEQVCQPNKMDIYHYTTPKILDNVSPYTIQELDPVHVDNMYASQAMAKIYEGLLGYDPLSYKVCLVPKLAAEMPTISSDGLVYTFKIKPGIKFHSSFCFSWRYTGRELQASDFVYSIKRIADTKNQSPHFILLANRIKGLDAWREQNANQELVDYGMIVEGVKALDRYTLQFTLNAPWPQFLHVLSMPFCSVVPYEAVMYYGDEFAKNPIGTGPFMLEKMYQGVSKLFFSKNYSFREKEFPDKELVDRYGKVSNYSNYRLPFVDKVITHMIPSESQRWLAFQRSEVDTLDLQNASKLTTEVIQDDSFSSHIQNEGVSIYKKKPQLISHYFVFNCNQAPFKNNVKLRQAMSMAFDRQQYNALFFNNEGIIPQMFIPPHLPGYKEGYTNSYNYDLEKAKQYLLAAGYPNGEGLPIIVLDTIVGTTYRKQAEFFMQCMKKIGIKVLIISNMYPVLQEKRKHGTTMMHALSIEPDCLNNSFLYFLKHTKHYTTESYNNALYTLYAQTMASKEGCITQSLYDELNALVAENMPMLCTVYEWDSLSLKQGWVINYLRTAAYFHDMDQYIDIHKEGKKKGKEKEIDKLHAIEEQKKKKIKEGIAKKRKKEKEERQRAWAKDKQTKKQKNFFLIDQNID